MSQRKSADNQRKSADNQRKSANKKRKGPVSTNQTTKKSKKEGAKIDWDAVIFLQCFEQSSRSRSPSPSPSRSRSNSESSVESGEYRTDDSGNLVTSYDQPRKPGASRISYDGTMTLPPRRCRR